MRDKIKFIYYDMNSHEQQSHIRDIVYPVTYKDLNEMANVICKSLKLSGDYSYVYYDIFNDVSYSKFMFIREATVQISYYSWNLDN